MSLAFEALDGDVSLSLNVPEIEFKQGGIEEKS